MERVFLPHFVKNVAKRLADDRLQVASQWVSGSIAAQESSVQGSSQVADLVADDGAGALVIEFKRSNLSSVEAASIVQHRDLIERVNAGARYALVIPGRLSEKAAREYLTQASVPFVEEAKPDAAAAALEDLVPGLMAKRAAEAADAFRLWYSSTGQERNFPDHRMALLTWVADIGAPLVLRRYSLFARVVEVLAGGGFKTLPAPPEAHFQAHVSAYDRDHRD